MTTCDYQAMLASLEVWKPVHQFEGFYEVSNFGRVRSCDRIVLVRREQRIHSKPLHGRFLKPYTDKDGYRHVNLSIEGITKYCKVHHLVLEAFVAPKPLKMECRHLNGDPSDNRLNNLSWGTSKENSADQRFHGTHRMRARKLNEEDVGRIRELLSAGLSQRRIAQMFNVSKGAIQAIKDQRTWVC